MLKITFTTIIFFIIPGAFLLTIGLGPWKDEIIDYNSIERVVFYLGWAWLGTGALVFLVRTKKLKRSQKEDTAREKIKILVAGKIVHFRSEQSLVPDDVRRLKRGFYSSIPWFILFACLPVPGFFLVDGEGKIFMYLFMAAWIGMICFFIGMGYDGVSNVLKEGKKQIIKGVITERFKKYYDSENVDREHAEVPYFKIGEEELLVTPGLNRKYNVGDVVEFHFVDLGYAKKGFKTFYTNYFIYHKRVSNI